MSSAMKNKRKAEPFSAARALMRGRDKIRLARLRHAVVLGALLPLGACQGTVGDVLTLPTLDAPLGTVPAGCADARQAGTVCFYESGWKDAAALACKNTMTTLSASVLLDACGPGFYRGVYYRCCGAAAARSDDANQ